MDTVRRHRELAFGTCASLLLLLVFLCMQRWAKDLLMLPGQWLWVALIPTMVGLVVGGHIRKIKVGEMEAELPDKRVEALPEVGTLGDSPSAVPKDWTKERAAEYERTGGMCLVHVYKKSAQPNQDFDAFIYLVEHQKDSRYPRKTGFESVERVEFYLGASWDDKIFTIENTGSKILGIRVHAFGTFLVTCRVTPRDPEKAPFLIHRYIDCEMLG